MRTTTLGNKFLEFSLKHFSTSVLIQRNVLNLNYILLNPYSYLIEYMTIYKLEMANLFNVLNAGTKNIS